METAVADLNSLDGSGFERLCARILERLDYGEVEQVGRVGDGGRDLLVHGRNGSLIVVQCKHWLSGSVGRPEVQKLHSAAIESDASGGMLVTSGRFTVGARDFARRCARMGCPIELVDLSPLSDMAERAGIRLVQGDGESVPSAESRVSGGRLGEDLLLYGSVAVLAAAGALMAALGWIGLLAYLTILACGVALGFAQVNIRAMWKKAVKWCLLFSGVSAAGAAVHEVLLMNRRNRGRSPLWLLAIAGILALGVIGLTLATAYATGRLRRRGP